MDQRQLQSLIVAGAIAEVVVYRVPAGWALLARGPDLPPELGKRLQVHLHTARGDVRQFKNLDTAVTAATEIGWHHPVILDAGPWCQYPETGIAGD